MPHLDSAVTLARYLLRDAAEAEDAVQDACLRALRHIDGLRDADGRAWLLTIVRNVCLTRRQQSRRREASSFDEEAHSPLSAEPGPERDAHTRQTAQRVRHAVAELPEEFREVIVLRELEELSYKEIADVLGVPAGTVMSRLNRGRARLRELLGPAEDRG